MVACGLLVRMLARHGKEDEVERFLRSALPMVAMESGTKAWFALRFDRSEYGIFDAFPDEAARAAHLAGPVAGALMARADELFEAAPRIQKVEVLADKMPDGTASLPNTKGVLLTFKAKSGHESELATFLRGAQPLVMEEPNTTAWFAIRIEDGEYGIFDVFPDSGARFSHLTGHVPRELAKHSLSLLGSVPELRLLNVEAERLAA